MKKNGNNLVDDFDDDFDDFVEVKTKSKKKNNVTPIQEHLDRERDENEEQGPDYYQSMFGISTNTELLEKLAENMHNINSVTYESSQLYGQGDRFTSQVTGYECVIDLAFSRERHEHLEYLLCFRVFKESAEADNIKFNYANPKQRRRKPHLTRDSLWSYRPTLCNNYKNDCPLKDSCSYCHSRDELIYHPLVFKTKICDQPLDSNGHCSKFGRHCAKAHSEVDRRIPYNHKQTQEKPRDRWDPNNNPRDKPHAHANHESEGTQSNEWNRPKKEETNHNIKPVTVKKSKKDKLQSKIEEFRSYVNDNVEVAIKQQILSQFDDCLFEATRK